MKMTTKEAFAYVEASRLQYNQNCPEDQLDFDGAYDMLVECTPNVGTDKDVAALRAIDRAIERARKNAMQNLFKRQLKKIKHNLVQRHLEEGFDGG